MSHIVKPNKPNIPFVLVKDISQETKAFLMGAHCCSMGQDLWLCYLACNYNSNLFMFGCLFPPYTVKH